MNSTLKTSIKTIIFLYVFGSSLCVLTEEEKAFVSSYPKQNLITPENLQNRCTIVQNFYKELNKNIYSDVLNSKMDFYEKYVQPGGKTGKISDVSLLSLYNTVQFDFGIEEGNKDLAFALELADFFSMDNSCLQFAQKIHFLMRFLENKLCLDDRKFLFTLMDRIEHEQAKLMLLMTISQLIETDESFLNQVAESFENQKEETLSQFVQMYHTILLLKDKKKADDKLQFVADSMNQALHTGGFYSFLFLIYQLRLLTIASDTNIAWFLDNIGFYYLTAYCLNHLHQYQKEQMLPKKQLIFGFTNMEENNMLLARDLTEMSTKMAEEANNENTVTSARILNLIQDMKNKQEVHDERGGNSKKLLI